MEAIRTERRRKYKVNRKLGMTRYNAAMASGFNKAVALRRDADKVPALANYQDLFEQAGMTNKERVKECINGMNATKVVSLETDERTQRGQKVYKKYEVEDWGARHKYLETMLKLCKQLDVGGKKGDTNVLVIGTLAERIKTAREKNADGLRVRSAHMEGEEVIVDADVVITSNEGEKDDKEIQEETGSN